METAQQLTDLEVRVMSELREAERGSYLHDQTAFYDAVKRGLQDHAIAAPLDGNRSSGHVSG